MVERYRLSMLAGCAALALAAGVSVASACTPERIAAVIDATGQKLRRYNGEVQPRLLARMRELGERNGWSSGEIEERAYALVSDDETRALDEQASGLLVRLDRLGGEAATCERLAELETVSSQLMEVSAAKGAQMSARLDAALRAAPSAKSDASNKSEAGNTPSAAELPKGEPPAKTVKPPPSAVAAAKAPPPVAAPIPAWQTQTSRAPEVAPPTAVIAELPQRAGDLADAEFTEQDIRAAGQGLFGTISANLASVFEFAFKSYGRPTGYILGNEGGGALVAGLRYGDGMLVTKRAGERKVYWQGPTVGYDFGLTGSRVMFLVYNLKDGEELFARFAGVDGSAYLVGGVGITFLKKGRVVLAPIRSGVGVRLGANVGYLKFTPSPSLNPF